MRVCRGGVQHADTIGLTLHTHTHTHTHTHRHTHTDRHFPLIKHKVPQHVTHHSLMRTHTYTHTHAHTCTHMHCAHTFTHTLICTDALGTKMVRLCDNKMPASSLKCQNVCYNTHTQAHTDTQTHTLTHSHTITHRHTHTHTHTNTHTQTHTHTHTNTHTQMVRPQSRMAEDLEVVSARGGAEKGQGWGFSAERGEGMHGGEQEELPMPHRMTHTFESAESDLEEGGGDRQQVGRAGAERKEGWGRGDAHPNCPLVRACVWVYVWVCGWGWGWGCACVHMCVVMVAR